MVIQSEVLAKWKSLYQTGDKKKIAETYIYKVQKGGLTTVQGWITNTFKFGHCPDQLYPVIKSYYDKVEKSLITKA